MPAADAGAGVELEAGEAAAEIGGGALAAAAGEGAAEGFETTRCSLQPSEIPLELRDSQSFRMDPLKTTLSRDASHGILLASCCFRSDTVAAANADASNSQEYVWPDTVMQETLTFAAAVCSWDILEQMAFGTQPLLLVILVI